LGENRKSKSEEKLMGQDKDGSRSELKKEARRTK